MANRGETPSPAKRLRLWIPIAWTVAGLGLGLLAVFSGADLVSPLAGIPGVAFAFLTDWKMVHHAVALGINMLALGTLQALLARRYSGRRSFCVALVLLVVTGIPSALIVWDITYKH